MPTTRSAGFAVLLALAAIALPAAAGAADGSLTVTVRDNYGVIPRAAVRATNGATGVGQRAVTDNQGVARFAALPAGTYEVRAAFPGFADAAELAVALAEGEAKSLELVLGVAHLSTSVTVETANRREQLLLDVAEPVTLIEKTQIEDTGARSAKDVLVEQSGSGIQVNAGGGQGYISINGIPNKGVLVLVNGRRYLGKDANGNLNLEELQLLGLQRIEVVKGPGSALYGSDALGGVVNFIISPPGAPGTTNTLKTSGGSYNDYRVDDVFSWRGGRAGAKVAVGYRTYDGFDLESCTGEDAATGACKPMTITGKVSQVLTETLQDKMHPGMAILVDSKEKGRVRVHLGPVWYLERQEFDLDPGQEVQVKGICLEEKGETRLIAAQVTVGDSVLLLRDQEGRPMWEALRKR